LRDGAAGLGTLTFVDPESGLFGGLGHGICDADSGEVIMMDSGEVLGVILGGIHKGESGKPGELCGVLTDRDMGDLTLNSECGVFGVLVSPSAIMGDKIPIGHRDEVTEGEAKIISTLKNGKSAEYKIEIYDIDRDSDGSKSFRIRVTDETLKSLTGGIVRGMSGSPIIQNGKLIGAVTHVLVADPTEGYGIFIENMLQFTNHKEQQKAA
jgi:stage IV sporulation protein B